MLGKYSIEVYNNRVHFSFEVRRNITIVQGNSGTGKTTLINLVAEYERLGKNSGITLNCEKKCVVLQVGRWQEFIRETKDSIIFVEENMPFIRTTEFAECVNYSDNYFVIIYRDSLPQLAYSIDEIYGIRQDRETQKYVSTKRVYESMYHIYNLDKLNGIKPDVVVTEDANSGYEFFDAAFACECVPSEGKSKVHNVMLNHALQDKTVLGIVDGAAFGADMQKMMTSLSGKEDKCCLYAPESFEYLILKSGIVDFPQKKLEQTYDYADSSKYESWEQYYTEQLGEITRNTNHQYSKTRLNPFYTTEGNIKRLKRTIEGIDFGD